MTERPPLNTYIEWDGSETPPVPEGTDLTYWDECGKAYREEHDDGCFWDTITAYLVHSYPPEEERETCWRSRANSQQGEWGTCIIRDGVADWSTWEPKQW